MNDYYIITQPSGFFFWKFFRRVALDEKCKKIYFVNTNNKINLLKNIIYIFRLELFTKILPQELMWLLIMKFELFFYNKKIEYINKVESINLADIKMLISIGSPLIFGNYFIKKNVDKLLLNLHGGILPYQRGLFSPYWAIKNNDKYIGATLHVIDDKIDNGEILSNDFILRTSCSSYLAYKIVLESAFKILDNYTNFNIKKIKEISSQNFKGSKLNGYPI